MKKGLLTASILVFVLMMAACGANEAPAPQPAAPAAPAADAPAAQVGGVAMADSNVTQPGVLPIVYEPVTLTIGLSENMLVSDYYDNALTRYLEELTGVNIEFVFYAEGADGNTQLNLQVAAGADLPDLLYQLGIEAAATREAFGNAGAIIPLNDFIRDLGYFTNRAVSQTDIYLAGQDPWIFGVSGDGNIYGYMVYHNPLGVLQSSRAWYNADFAEYLGFSEDDWTGGLPNYPIPTYDWFLSFLRAVRDNDANQNGDMFDEIPLTGGTGWRQQLPRWVMQMFIYDDYAGTNQFWMVRNGELDVTYNKPEFREGLRFLNMMFNEELFHDFSLTQAGPGLTATVNQQPHRVGITVSGGVGIYDDEARQKLRPMPVVEGPGGFISTNYHLQIPTFPWAISSNSRHPEVAFRFLDAMASSPDFPIYTRYGVRDLDWRTPEPGEISIYDGIIDLEPYIVQLQMTWGAAVTDSHWKTAFGIDYMNRLSSLAWNGDPLDPEFMHAQAIRRAIPYAPSEFPINLNWTGAELERWAETRVTVRNFVDQSVAEFITNQRCIETEWDSYLATLENMGALDLLEADREVHRRMTQ